MTANHNFPNLAGRLASMPEDERAVVALLMATWLQHSPDAKSVFAKADILWRVAAQDHAELRLDERDQALAVHVARRVHSHPDGNDPAVVDAALASYVHADGRHPFFAQYAERRSKELLFDKPEPESSWLLVRQKKPEGRDIDR
jgi:hypothetical protein